MLYKFITVDPLGMVANTISMRYIIKNLIIAMHTFSFLSLKTDVLNDKFLTSNSTFLKYGYRNI